MDSHEVFIRKKAKFGEVLQLEVFSFEVALTAVASGAELEQRGGDARFHTHTRYQLLPTNEMVRDLQGPYFFLPTEVCFKIFRLVGPGREGNSGKKTSTAGWTILLGPVRAEI